MSSKYARNRIIVPVVEMTPMIDIIFLLIIFFMVAAQFAQRARVELDLPNEIGENATGAETSTLIINIKSNGDILVDNTMDPVTVDELSLLVQNNVGNKNNNWRNISVRADENSKTNVLNEVLVVLNEHGVSATRIATRTP